MSSEKRCAIYIVKIEDSRVINRRQEINKLADIKIIKIIIKIITATCTYRDANIGTSSSNLDFERRLPRVARHVSHNIRETSYTQEIFVMSRTLAKPVISDDNLTLNAILYFYRMHLA